MSIQCIIINFSIKNIYLYSCVDSKYYPKLSKKSLKELLIQWKSLHYYYNNIQCDRAKVYVLFIKQVLIYFCTST